MKIALIDGLPYRQSKNSMVIDVSDVKYPWDSELFGVPEFRAHADKMFCFISRENPNAKIMVSPFYPKFNSIRKNYLVLAENIKTAINFECSIVCICLEVLGAVYLSSEMLAAYKYAHDLGAIICVSAGNHRPFKNPLIYKKYTIPVINMAPNIHVRQHPYFMKGKALNAVGVYSDDSKTNCSKATAVFAGRLSNLPREHPPLNGPNNIKNLFKEHTNERNHHITFFNG